MSHSRRRHRLLTCLLVLAPLVALLLPAPAGAQGTAEVRYLAPGTRYETPMYIIRGAAPGPVLLVTGGVHGDEIAGWMAARQLVKRPIRAGTFIVIPEANRPGVEARTRRCPVAGFDLNREFPAGSNTAPTRLIAREIWNVLGDYRVQWYLDLHEALDFYKNPKVNSVGQTLIHYPRPAATRMGNLAVRELNRGIGRSLHQFILISWPVPGSVARAAGAHRGVNAYIMETSRKLALSTRIGYQLQVVDIFLRELGMAGTPAPGDELWPAEAGPAGEEAEAEDGPLPAESLDEKAASG